DLLLGAEPGTPMLVRNSGTESERRFEAPERLRWDDGSLMELYAIDTGEGSSWGPIEAHFERILPRSADWDGDGVPDLITGSMSLRILWMRGVWHGEELRFKRPRVFQLGDQEVEVAHRVQPCLVDLDGDGFLDVVALDPWNMVTAYFGDGTENFSRSKRLLDEAGNP